MDEYVSSNPEKGQGNIVFGRIFSNKWANSSNDKFYKAINSSSENNANAFLSARFQIFVCVSKMSLRTQIYNLLLFYDFHAAGLKNINDNLVF